MPTESNFTFYISDIGLTTLITLYLLKTYFRKYLNNDHGDEVPHGGGHQVQGLAGRRLFSITTRMTIITWMTDFMLLGAWE